MLENLVLISIMLFGCYSSYAMLAIARLEQGRAKYTLRRRPGAFGLPSRVEFVVESVCECDAQQYHSRVFDFAGIEENEDE
mgnify:CR=1 FL=1